MNNLEELAAKVKSLSPPDQLVLAGELLRAGRTRLALQIAGNVVDDLRLADVMTQIKGAQLTPRDDPEQKREGGHE